MTKPVEPKERKEPTCGEIEDLLRGMEAAKMGFYRNAVLLNWHPFVEFAGLMKEYINILHDTYREGREWSEPLQLKPYQIDYIAEKLDCIFGGQLRAILQAKPDAREKLGEEVETIVNRFGFTGHDP